MESTSTLEVLTRIATALERLVSPHTPLPTLSALNSLNSVNQEMKKESDGLGESEREGKPTKRGGRKARAPRTAFPDGFTFDDRAKTLAEALKLNPYRELGRFKDKSLANGYIYSDWQAAFRNWLRSTNDFKVGK